MSNNVEGKLPESPVNNQKHVSWPMFFVACLFVALSFCFAMLAFFKQNLTSDQQRILFLWALPVSSAIASGLFAGSISVSGSLISGLKVGAAGGFAVWLISMFLLMPNPDMPVTLKVSQFNFLVESSVERRGVNTVLTRLERRSNRDYMIQSANDLKIAFGLVVEGFRVVNGKTTKLRLTFSILGESGEELASSDIETFDSIAEWQDLPSVKAIGTENIIRAFSLSKNDVGAGLSMPIIILLDNFKEGEFPREVGAIRVSVRDEYSGATIAYEERVGFVRLLN